MNTKVVITLVVAAALLGGLLLLSSNSKTDLGTSAPTATTTAATSTQPTFTFGNPVTNANKPRAHFGSASFTSSSTYPVVSGIANTTKVGIIINNSKNMGVVGTWEIPVTKDGQWSYSSSVALPPGTYTALLILGTTTVETVPLTVLSH